MSAEAQEPRGRKLPPHFKEVKLNKNGISKNSLSYSTSCPKGLRKSTNTGVNGNAYPPLMEMEYFIDSIKDTLNGIKNKRQSQNTFKVHRWEIFKLECVLNSLNKKINKYFSKRNVSEKEDQAEVSLKLQVNSFEKELQSLRQLFEPTDLHADYGKTSNIIDNQGDILGDVRQSCVTDVSQKNDTTSNTDMTPNQGNTLGDIHEGIKTDFCQKDGAISNSHVTDEQGGVYRNTKTEFLQKDDTPSNTNMSDNNQGDILGDVHQYIKTDAHRKYDATANSGLNDNHSEFWCNVCECPIYGSSNDDYKTLYNISEHVKGLNHLKNINNGRSQFFLCKVCDFEVSMFNNNDLSLFNVQTHLKGLKHTRKNINIDVTDKEEEEEEVVKEERNVQYYTRSDNSQPEKSYERCTSCYSKLTHDERSVGFCYFCTEYSLLTYREKEY